MPPVPSFRVTALNQALPRPGGEYVLYWMTMFRRLRWNYSLDRAVEWARQLGKPLVIFEPLRAGYPWASDRLHTFVIEGMRDTAAAVAKLPVTYYPYLEPTPGADRGLLAAWAERAAVIVADDFPCFFLPRMLLKAAADLPVLVEKVDSNGLLPLACESPQVFQRAYDFRRYLQRRLRPHLDEHPEPDPLAGLKLPRLPAIPAEIARRWPSALAALGDIPAAVARLPIDHHVGPAAFAGGASAAGRALREFLDHRLALYGDERNEPDRDCTSGFSPYLHFGHLSVHEVFQALARHEGWTPARLGSSTAGKREGWWGMSPAAESFLDELVTWRELGYHFASRVPNYDRYESLPEWARATLAKHACDPRPYVYTLDQLAGAQTHDRLWNAAQNQLLREGRMHNYLRMLWGKKVLEWSPTPEEALTTMIELNNRYAVDGRNPNSYSGICWVLGRFDRPWAPERPIFGNIRYMSSENTARKLRVEGYLARHDPQAARELW